MKLLRKRQVLAKVPFGNTTLYDKIGAGKFPAPRRTGPNSVAWVEEEIDAWIEALPRTTDEAA